MLGYFDQSLCSFDNSKLNALGSFWCTSIQCGFCCGVWNFNRKENVVMLWSYFLSHKSIGQSSRQGVPNQTPSSKPQNSSNKLTIFAQRSFECFRSGKWLARVFLRPARQTTLWPRNFILFFHLHDSFTTFKMAMTSVQQTFSVQSINNLLLTQFAGSISSFSFSNKNDTLVPLIFLLIEFLSIETQFCQFLSCTCAKKSARLSWLSLFCTSTTLVVFRYFCWMHLQEFLLWKVKVESSYQI